MIPNIQFNSLKEEVTYFDSEMDHVAIYLLSGLYSEARNIVAHRTEKHLCKQSVGDELFYFINLCLQRNLQKVYLKSQTTCQ